MTFGYSPTSYQTAPSAAPIIAQKTVKLMTISHAQSHSPALLTPIVDQVQLHLRSCYYSAPEPNTVIVMSPTKQQPAVCNTTTKHFVLPPATLPFTSCCLR